jgi:hypothetical protein
MSSQLSGLGVFLTEETIVDRRYDNITVKGLQNEIINSQSLTGD